jgi:outer membrane protein assembly factor BamD (BamD/ComL family)
VLAPEVALALTAALAAEGQHGQACAEADAFARHFPHDPATHARLLRLCGP